MAMQLLPCSDHGNTFTDRPTKAGERSDRFQIDRGRFAVLPLLELVGDLLILVEIAESGAFHRRDVHEHVLGFVVRLNEAETLARVEPFHGTDRHGCSPWMMSPRTGVRGASNYPREKPESAPWRGGRGLTQVEFDRASIARTQAKRVGAGGGNKNGRSALRPFPRKEKRTGSGAAPPQSAVAPRHELQVVLVAGPFFVLRQLDLFLRRFPAFPF